MPISGGQYRLQFTPYAYSAALAAFATFVPPANTIVMSAYLDANQDLSIRYGAQSIADGADMGANSRGWIGATYCEGVNIGYKNDNVGAQTLVLYGVSMA